MNVFVVEDSLEIRERLRSMIAAIPNVELLGEVESEEAALHCVGVLQPDVVILDLNLSGGSGFEVLRKIGEQALPTKVIVLTNYSHPHYRKKSLEMGAAHFLDKTFEIDALESILAASSGPVHKEES